MTTKHTPRQRAVIDFWDDVTLLKIQDAPLNFWDSLKWWQKVPLVFLAVVICIVVGGMTAGYLVGVK